MTKPTAAPAAALLTILTLPLALDAGPLPRPQLSFEKNLGQTHESVDFTARGRRYAATLHAGSYSMALRTAGGAKPPRWTLSAVERFARPSSTPWVISMYLIGANAEAAAEGLQPLAARSHYLRGKDPSEWRTDVPHYGRVRYQDVYPGIGEFISIFATGLGAVDNRPPTGAVTPRSPLARTKTKPVVAIGGVNAPVSFSGLAPDFVGLYQVNPKVAEGTPTGDAVDLLLSSGEVPSNAVTIAVAPR